MDRNEATATINMAIGRLFRLGSRPEQPGDAEAYHQLRSAAMNAADVLGIGTNDDRTCWARDRSKGAAGD